MNNDIRFYDVMLFIISGGGRIDFKVLKKYRIMNIEESIVVE